MRKNRINILFICPYPIDEAPSQRFRFEQYFDLLKAKGFLFEVRPFLSLSTWQLLYKPGHTIFKTMGILRGFLSRILILPSIRHFDFVFIHREASPIGPAWFEWLVAKVFRKKIIYDFDDAVWLPNTSKENGLAARLKWHSKVLSIFTWCYAISSGNEYLCNFARPFNNRVSLNPTTIDTERLHNPDRYPQKTNSDRITIGWTGTHSTLKYLDFLIPVIQLLEKKFSDRLRFMVIADKKPTFALSSLHFVPWSKETEVQDLLQFDIGIMPLTDDIWAKGKCGFKALQYLSLRIPAVVSPVGVNAEIVETEISGFVCNEPNEWITALTRLIESEVLRKKMGESGRKKVIESYSVASNSENFLSLFS